MHKVHLLFWAFFTKHTLTLFVNQCMEDISMTPIISESFKLWPPGLGEGGEGGVAVLPAVFDQEET